MAISWWTIIHRQIKTKRATKQSSKGDDEVGSLELVVLTMYIDWEIDSTSYRKHVICHLVVFSVTTWWLSINGGNIIHRQLLTKSATKISSKEDDASRQYRISCLDTVLTKNWFHKLQKASHLSFSCLYCDCMMIGNKLRDHYTSSTSDQMGYKTIFKRSFPSQICNSKNLKTRLYYN